MTGIIEQLGKIAPLINLSVIGVAWFSKTNNEINTNMSQLNGMMKQSYTKFQEDLEKAKVQEIGYLKNNHEVEKEKIALNLQQKENTILSLKQEIELMEKTSSNKMVENLISIKTNLEKINDEQRQKIEKLSNEKNIPELRQEISNIIGNSDNQVSKIIDEQIGVFQESVNKYANRMENAKAAAKWLKSNSEDILAKAKVNLENESKEEVDLFVQDIKDYINWACDSLESGSYLDMHGLGISSKIPNSTYTNLFHNIKNQASQFFQINVVEELEVFLDRIVESINQ
jgi:hypothetical protein